MNHTVFSVKLILRLKNLAAGNVYHFQYNEIIGEQVSFCRSSLTQLPSQPLYKHDKHDMLMTDTKELGCWGDTNWFQILVLPFLALYLEMNSWICSCTSISSFAEWGLCWYLPQSWMMRIKWVNIEKTHRTVSSTWYFLSKYNEYHGRVKFWSMGLR